VPHEGKRASYGGSYMEEVDWWKKPRKKSRINELKVMAEEIMLLKGVLDNNRPLWYLTYPFHLGLYLLGAFIALLVVGAIAQIAGVSIGPLTAFTKLIGVAGFILGLIGAVGLFWRRFADSSIRNYSSFEHFFNLSLFIITIGVGILTWLFVDPNFNMAGTFVANLISFNLAPIKSQLFLVQILLASLLIAYIPLTHMSHFFMKYFLYHDIRWGDEPNVNNPATQAKIAAVLNYPVTWAAPHIAGHGKHTWAEVATFNPAAEPEKPKKE
ncbi:MAG TPA: respiratory nitrate reductase subunit gamma, partial [Desulfatiglandales bacterium]|nr:respiratory nitrate reductase subunit gamma [Desulfatiglandales bacterium]